MLLLCCCVAVCFIIYCTAFLVFLILSSFSVCLEVNGSILPVFPYGQGENKFTKKKKPITLLHNKETKAAERHWSNFASNVNTAWQFWRPRGIKHDSPASYSFLALRLFSAYRKSCVPGTLTFRLYSSFPSFLSLTPVPRLSSPPSEARDGLFSYLSGLSVCRVPKR